MTNTLVKRLHNVAVTIDYRSDDVTNEIFLIFQISIPDMNWKSRKIALISNFMKIGLNVAEIWAGEYIICPHKSLYFSLGSNQAKNTEICMGKLYIHLLISQPRLSRFSWNLKFKLFTKLSIHIRKQNLKNLKFFICDIITSLLY